MKFHLEEISLKNERTESKEIVHASQDDNLKEHHSIFSYIIITIDCKTEKYSPRITQQKPIEWEIEIRPTKVK